MNLQRILVPVDFSEAASLRPPDRPIEFADAHAICRARNSWRPAAQGATHS